MGIETKLATFAEHYASNTNGNETGVIDRDLVAVKQWTKHTQNYQLQISLNRTFKEKEKKRKKAEQISIKSTSNFFAAKH